MTSCKVGRCHHVQISELYSMEIRDQVVVDFPTAQEVGNFRPSERGLSLFIMLYHGFSLSGSIVLFFPLES
jgi:hypothetical protein